LAKNDEKDDDKEKDAAEGAEGGEGAAEGEEGAKKGLGKKKLIILIAVGALLVIGGGGAALYFTGMLGKHQTTEEKQAKKDADEKGAAAFYSLGDILVNLSGEGKHPNYLKVKVSLELADAKDVALMDAIKPRIIDNFQVYLRELRIDDLRGSAGLYRLREELLLRVTEAAQPIRVRDVLFLEMLVQ